MDNESNRDYKQLFLALEQECIIGNVQEVDKLLIILKKKNPNNCRRAFNMCNNSDVFDVFFNHGIIQKEDLCNVCFNSKYNLVLKFIEKFKDPPLNNALYSACEGGHKKIAVLLIKHGANNFCQCLNVACLHQHTDIAALMIKHGADPTNALNICLSNGLDISFKFLINYFNVNDIFFNIVMNRLIDYSRHCFKDGYSKILCYLLDLPFEVNKNFINDIFLLGCKHDNKKIIYFALQQGAEINYGLRYLSNKEIILELIEKGGNINSRDLDENDIEYLVKRNKIKTFGWYTDTSVYILNKIKRIKTMTDILLPEILNICGDY